jgi:hypothetical protein
MWVLVVLCVVLTFVIAIAAQLNLFNLGVLDLIKFKRVSDDSN